MTKTFDLESIQKEFEQIRLSQNFTLWELIDSITGKNRRIVAQFTPSEKIVNNLRIIATKLLQPIRTFTGLPIKVNSGFRCRQVNTLIGGSATSQHMEGEAADITLFDPKNNKFLWDKIISSKIEFDQLIWEFGTNNAPAWIHISLNLDGKNRRQILKAYYDNKGKKAYKKFEA